MEKIMTIANNYVPIRQEANGNTKSFTFDFRVLDDDYLVVYQEINGKQTVVDSSDYTVNAQEVGGTVDFNTAPAAGSYIIITRDVPLDQLTPYRTSSGFPANRVEENLDKLTAITQQLKESVDRAPKLPVGTAGVDVTLPLPDAGKAIIWNDAGNGFVNSKDNFDDIVANATEQANIATQKAAEASASASEAAESATTAQQAADKVDANMAFLPYLLEDFKINLAMWTANSGNYPFRATVLKLVYKEAPSDNFTGLVSFADEQILSGNYAPYADFSATVGNGNTTLRATIYAKEKPQADFTIPVIMWFMKGA
nr:MAG TPA: tail fiber protein [Caudoviricetes sp.]